MAHWATYFAYHSFSERFSGIVEVENLVITKAGAASSKLINWRVARDYSKQLEVCNENTLFFFLTINIERNLLNLDGHVKDVSQNIIETPRNNKMEGIIRAVLQVVASRVLGANSKQNIARSEKWIKDNYLV